jgi:hypothetical protein
MMATEEAILEARGQFDGIVDLVRQAAERGERIDLVERDLMRNLLALGHSLMTAYVASRATATAGRRSRRPRAPRSAGLPSPTSVATCRSSAR